MQPSTQVPRITALFDEVNSTYFDGVIPLPTVRLSQRMTQAAGLADLDYWELVISGPYHDRYGWQEELLDTVKHECIHFYLHTVHRPYGHTKEFQTISQRIGATLRSRPMPRCRPVYRYVVACPHCQDRWRTGSWSRNLACRACCDHYNEGRYAPQFALTLVERQRVPA